MKKQKKEHSAIKLLEQSIKEHQETLKNDRYFDFPELKKSYEEKIVLMEKLLAIYKN